MQTDGPGTEVVKKLQKQNDKLLANVVALQEKIIKDTDATNSRLTLVINSLSHLPSSLLIVLLVSSLCGQCLGFLVFQFNLKVVNVNFVVAKLCCFFGLLTMLV